MFTVATPQFDNQMSLYTISQSVKKDANLVGNLIDDLEFVNLSKNHLAKHGKTEQGLEILDASSRLTKITGVNFSDVSTDMNDMTVALENLAKTIWDGILALIKKVAELIGKLFHLVTFGIFKSQLMYQMRKLDNSKLDKLESEIPTYDEMTYATRTIQNCCNFLKNFHTFINRPIAKDNCILSDDDLFELKLVTQKNTAGYFGIRHNSSARAESTEKKEYTFSGAGWSAQKFNDVLHTFQALDPLYSNSNRAMDSAVKEIKNKVEDLRHKDQVGSLSDDDLSKMKYLNELLLTSADTISAIAKYIITQSHEFKKIDAHLKKCQEG